MQLKQLQQLSLKKRLLLRLYQGFQVFQHRQDLTELLVLKVLLVFVGLSVVEGLLDFQGQPEVLEVQVFRDRLLL